MQSLHVDRMCKKAWPVKGARASRTHPFCAKFHPCTHARTHARMHARTTLIFLLHNTYTTTFVHDCFQMHVHTMTPSSVHTHAHVRVHAPCTLMHVARPCARADLYCRVVLGTEKSKWSRGGGCWFDYSSGCVVALATAIVRSF